MTDHAATLRAAGSVLYGPAWQSELARHLGIADRTVRYWIAGERPIPAGVWGDIAALLERRGSELDDAIDWEDGEDHEEPYGPATL